MDAPVEIIDLDAGRPFRAFVHGGAAFPTYWHRHAEFELSCGPAGGELRVGDVVETPAAPRALLLAPQIPHAWTEPRPYEHVVLQFRRDWLGAGFLDTTGCERLSSLLDRAAGGLVVEGAAALRVERALRAVVPLGGLAAIGAMLGCLDLFAQQPQRAMLVGGATAGLDPRLQRITEWIDGMAGEDIALADAAAVVDLHPKAFARWFRKASGHSFVGYLGHVRVRHACLLLRDRGRRVTDVALEVGFGTVANFNRTFQRLRRMTPSEYAKRFRPEVESSEPAEVRA